MSRTELRLEAQQVFFDCQNQTARVAKLCNIYTNVCATGLSCLTRGRSEYGMRTLVLAMFHLNFPVPSSTCSIHWYDVLGEQNCVHLTVPTPEILLGWGCQVVTSESYVRKTSLLDMSAERQVGAMSYDVMDM